jgi:TRAP-type C4-dicarboxylate transport system permease small subunit
VGEPVTSRHSSGGPPPLVVRIQSRITDVLGWLSGIALIALTLLITVHVVMRYVGGTGIRGADEVSAYLFIAMVYCGLALALRDGAFIRVELLQERLPEFVRRPVTVLVRLLSLAFVGLVTWRTWELMLASYESGLESIGVLRVVLWVPQAVIAVGCLALLMQIAVGVIWPDHIDRPVQSALGTDEESVPAADAAGAETTVRREADPS